MAPPRARLATDSRRPFGLRNAFGFRFTRASFARECLAFSSAMLAVLPESMRAGHLNCSARRFERIYIETPLTSTMSLDTQKVSTRFGLSLLPGISSLCRKLRPTSCPIERRY